MKRLRSILGNTLAWVSLALAVLTPFLLLGWFQHAVASAGLRIDPLYTGGEIARVAQREGYRIEIYRPAPRRSPFQKIDPFIQMVWCPADRLPARVSDEVDVDGDGVPDLLVTFDSKTLAGSVTPRNTRFRAMHGAGVISFAELIARVNDGIVVRTRLR